MQWLTDPETWIALLTLTALEIVLGIDNIIFISILAGKLPSPQQDRARVTGLAAAMLTRIALLFSIAWLIRLTSPLFTVLGQEISGRDIILIVGGLFLLAKSTSEIHDKLQGIEEQHAAAAPASFGGVILQIMLLDIVFSLDSVITAISDFIHKNPTLKVLALSFLLLIGISLVAEGLEFHIPKGYIYFAMAFSFFVELINLRVRPNMGGVIPVPEKLAGGSPRKQ
jgi:predicted tellurium resistance membrane protein TerC